MIRGITVVLAILAVSTSTAFAHRAHHRTATNAAPIVWPGSSDQALHAKNHRDSGYSAKNDYNADRTMRTHNAEVSPGGSNQAVHMKNHRDSGYKPKSDYNANGTMRTNN